MRKLTQGLEKWLITAIDSSARSLFFKLSVLKTSKSSIVAVSAGRRGVIAEAGKAVPGFLDPELMWFSVWTCVGSWRGVS